MSKEEKIQLLTSWIQDLDETVLNDLIWDFGLAG